MTTQRAVYNVTPAGLELRNFGLSLRCISLILEKAAGAAEPAAGVTPPLQLTDRLLVLDVENGAWTPIPNVNRVALDVGAQQGTQTGHLQRLTADHVEYTVPDGADANFEPFSAGYAFKTDPGDTAQYVLEPFILFGVTTLAAAEFNALVTRTGTPAPQ